MSNILYYISLPFLYLISLLPFPLLYGLSNFFFFVLYRIAGYRKGLVLTNLRNSFPEKSEAEIRLIAKKFFRHLSDMFLETFKTLTISKSQMLKHCYLTPEAKTLFTNYANQKQSVILVMGHQGNWEWAGNT